MPNTSKPGMIKSLQIAFTAYFTLDKEQRNIIFNRKIEGAHSPLYWKVIFEKIAEFDAKADAIRPQIGNTSGIFLGLGAFVNIFVAAIFLSNELYTLYIIAQSILLVVMGIGLLLLPIYIFLKFQDVPNYLREFVVPILVILNEEMKAEELLHLSIDLRKKARKDNQIDRQTNYNEQWTLFGRILTTAIVVFVGLMMIGMFSGNESFLMIGFIGLFLIFFVSIFNSLGYKYPRIIHTTHIFPWLKAQGKLYDGTKLDIEITDEIHRRSISRKKRGSSGKTKIKTKVKYKVRTTYQVNLALPTHKYDLAHDLQAASNGRRTAQGVKIKNKETARREVVKVNARTKTKTLNYSPDLYQFLGWVANAYQQFIVKKDA